jgi:hypothetical protein
VGRLITGYVMLFFMVCSLQYHLTYLLSAAAAALLTELHYL